MSSGDAWNLGCFMPNNPNCPAENGPDTDLSVSPLLVDLGVGRQELVVGQKSGAVWTVDPDRKGTPLWKIQIGRGSNQGRGAFWDGGERDADLCTDLRFQVRSDGGTFKDTGAPGIHAIDARSGRLLWSAVTEDHCNGRPRCEPGISAALTAIPGAVFAGHVDGWVRAYEGESGKVLWEVDTKLPVTAVNGETANGGSISGPGATVAQGHVIINSGYDFAFKMPANALLVYSVDGR